MANVLEFVQREIRTQRVTISRFIDMNDFNRTGFYRMMNDPVKIGEEDIIKMSRSLKLTEKKEQEFRQTIKQSISAYSEKEHERVLDILHTQPQFVDAPPVDVEFFSTNSESNRKINTYKDIIALFNPEEGAEIKIKILNCLSAPALSSLYTLITGLKELIIERGLTESAKVAVEHVIAIGTVTQTDKVAVLLNVAQMIQFSDYSIHFLWSPSDSYEMSDSGAFDLLENSVLVRETYSDDKKAKKNQYFSFFMSSNNGKRDYCFASNQYNYYDFSRTRFNRFKSEAALIHSFSTSGGASANEAVAKFEKPYRKLLVKGDPCLDSLHPSIWKQLLKSAHKDYPETLSVFRQKIDPEGHYSYLNDKTFFDMHFRFLEARFYENDHPGSVTILCIKAFAEFAKTGFTSEIKGVFPITGELLKIQISYMIDHIREYYGDFDHQQFYFYKKPFMSGLILSIFDNIGVVLSSGRCIDPVNTCVLFSDPEIARLLYTVITDSLSGDAVLSKEESLSFLSSFIEPID